MLYADTMKFHVIYGSSVKTNGSMGGLMQDHGQYGKSPFKGHSCNPTMENCDSMACPPNFALPWSISPGWRGNEQLKVSSIRFQWIFLDAIWSVLRCQQHDTSTTKWHIKVTVRRSCSGGAWFHGTQIATLSTIDVGKTWIAIKDFGLRSLGI